MVRVLDGSLVDRKDLGGWEWYVVEVQNVVGLLWSFFEAALVKIGTLLDAFFLEGSDIKQRLLLSDAVGLASLLTLPARPF